MSGYREMIRDAPLPVVVPPEVRVVRVKMTGPERFSFTQGPGVRGTYRLVSDNAGAAWLEYQHMPYRSD